MKTTLVAFLACALLGGVASAQTTDATKIFYEHQAAMRQLNQQAAVRNQWNQLKLRELVATQPVRNVSGPGRASWSYRAPDGRAIEGHQVISVGPHGPIATGAIKSTPMRGPATLTRWTTTSAGTRTTRAIVRTR